MLRTRHPGRRTGRSLQNLDKGVSRQRQRAAGQPDLQDHPGLHALRDLLQGLPARRRQSRHVATAAGPGPTRPTTSPTTRSAGRRSGSTTACAGTARSSGKTGRTSSSRSSGRTASRSSPMAAMRASRASRTSSSGPPPSDLLLCQLFTLLDPVLTTDYCGTAGVRPAAQINRP